MSLLWGLKDPVQRRKFRRIYTASECSRLIWLFKKQSILTLISLTIIILVLLFKRRKMNMQTLLKLNMRKRTTEARLAAAIKRLKNLSKKRCQIRCLDLLTQTVLVKSMWCRIVKDANEFKALIWIKLKMVWLVSGMKARAHLTDIIKACRTRFRCFHLRIKCYYRTSE